MTLEEFILVVLSSSVISTIVTKGWDYFSYKKKRDEVFKYNLLKIAFELEGYYLKSESALNEADLCDQSQGEIGKPISKPLDFNMPDVGVSLIGLKQTQLSRIFDFPQKIIASNLKLNAGRDILDGEDLYKEIKREINFLMEEAESLASSIRKDNGLPEKEWTD